MSDRTSAWDRIFNSFKDLYPRQFKKVESYRPLKFPEIEIKFRDGTTMIYDDLRGRARVVSTPSAYDNVSNTPPSDLYSKMSPDEYYRIFSINIDELMNRRQINATKLAVETGIGYRTIRRYIKGESIPNILDALKIAEALDCDITELILMH